MPSPSARSIAAMQGASVALLVSCPTLYVTSRRVLELRPLVDDGTCAVLFVAGIVFGCLSVIANWWRKG